MENTIFAPPTATPRELFEEPAWFACRTRSRAEKKVDEVLASKGVASYLPLVELEREWSDRKKQVAFPLFPSYVFARFSLSNMPMVVRTPGLIEVVRINGYPTPIRDKEIESVRALIEGARRVGVEPEPHHHLVKGTEVEVLEGPFRGLQGILTEVRGKTRIVVRLEAIRQAVSVEMEHHFVRPLPTN